MFDDLLYNFYRSIKLDKSLYKDPKSFENLSLCYAGIIIITNGIAGLVAQNNFIKDMTAVYGIDNLYNTSFLMALFSSLLGWLVWSTLIYIIGVKLFSENKKIVNFKSVLIVVGYGHAPGLFRFFTILPELLLPIIIITELWIFASLSMGVKEILNFKSNLKSFGVVILSFLIILLIFSYLVGGGFNFAATS